MLNSILAAVLQAEEALDDKKLEELAQGLAQAASYLRKIIRARQMSQCPPQDPEQKDFWN